MGRFITLKIDDKYIFALSAKKQSICINSYIWNPYSDLVYYILCACDQNYPRIMTINGNKNKTHGGASAIISGCSLCVRNERVYFALSRKSHTCSNLDNPYPLSLISDSIYEDAQFVVL